MQHFFVVINYTVKQFSVWRTTESSKRWQIWRNEATLLTSSDKRVKSSSIRGTGDAAPHTEDINCQIGSNNKPWYPSRPFGDHAKFSRHVCAQFAHMNLSWRVRALPQTDYD